MRWALGISLLLGVGQSGLALAQAPAADPAADEAARALFLNGSRLYEEGRYEEAILAFEEAYRLSGRPALLLNLGNAYERLGRLAEAVDALNRYRVFAPPADQDKLASRVLMLERRLAEAAAAPVVPPPVTPEEAPSPPPEPAPAPPRRKTLPWIAVGSGSVLMVAGSVAAAVTAGQGAAAREAGDQASYQAVRPVNNVGFGVGLVGGGVLAVGVVGVSLGGGGR